MNGSGRQRKLSLTYPNVVAKPGKVLLRAVVVTDLLIAAPWQEGEREKGKGKKKKQRVNWST